MDKRLDLMTYAELKERFEWIVSEIKRHEETYNNETSLLLKLLSDVAQELVRRSGNSIEDNGPTNGG